MQSWKHESVFAEYITEEELAGSYRSHRRTSSLDPSQRDVVLQNTIYSLQNLQVALAHHETESYWIGQLLTYLQQLQTSAPARSPDEQFNHLYLLRKWLFWVPVHLLQQQGGQGPALLTVAHYYATALSLDLLFPDLGSSFCAKIALSPLEAILNVTNAMQSEHAMDQTSVEIASLMQFPQQTALNFRTRNMPHAPPSQLEIPPHATMLTVTPETLSYTNIGNLSPAFAPSALDFTPSHTPTASQSSSSFLEVPVSQSGFTYGTQSWGSLPSPLFPPSIYTTQEEQIYGYGGLPTLSGGFHQSHGGFVQPVTIWT